MKNKKLELLTLLLRVISLFALIVLTACGSAAAKNDLTPTQAPTINQATTSPTPTSEAAVASSAQQALAVELKINTDQIKTISIDPVAWPDSCLGIQLPGILCAQHVVPGYKIVLEADHQTYEYHTAENGANPMIVPGLNIRWQDGEQCNTADIRYDRDVQYGACNGTPISAPLVDPIQADQLLGFYQSYAPFSAQTPAGQLNFNGNGPRQASPSEQRMIAEWARKVITETSGGQSDTALGLVINWHHEGGSPASCGDLLIYVTGEVDATSCNNTTSVYLGSTFLYSDQLEQLYTWVDTLKPFDLNQVDPGADGEYVHVVFSGQGTMDAPAYEEQAIQQFAAQIFSQAENWHSAPKTESTPEQVVSEFLSGLQNDPTGNHSLAQLSSSLSAYVQSGHPLPEILGIQNAYRSFGISNVIVNVAGDRARVDAGLNFVSPIKRSFILTQTNHTWQINTLVTYALPSLAIPDNTDGAESAILDYLQALQEHDPQTAWSWLSASTQGQISLAALGEQSASIDQLNPTTIQLISSSQGHLIYAVSLWVQPSPQNNSGWQTGENHLWFKLINTDLGWRIDQVSNQPIG